MDSVSLEFVLIAVGIVANGVFAGSEIALVSARVSRLARQRLVRGASAAMQLKETPETFLATIQIAITAVGTLTSSTVMRPTTLPYSSTTSRLMDGVASFRSPMLPTILSTMSGPTAHGAARRRPRRRRLGGDR